MAVHLQMTTEVSSVRAYDQPGGYEKRRPYRAIIKVTHLTETMVYLHAAVGKSDKETWDALQNLLRERGVTTVMLERHGKMKTIDL